MTDKIVRPGPTRPIGLQLEELMREHFGLAPHQQLKMILCAVRELDEQMDAVTVLRNVRDEDAVKVLTSGLKQVQLEDAATASAEPQSSAPDPDGVPPTPPEPY